MSGLEFEDGKSIYLEKRLNVFFYKNSLRGEMTDKLQIDIKGIVLSNKVKEILDINECNNIQYFPMLLTDSFVNNHEVELAKIKGDELEYESEIYENYQVANVIGLIDCIAHELSSLDYYGLKLKTRVGAPERLRVIYKEEEKDNDIDFIRHLVLDETKIPEDIKIFRLKDCPRILVFKEEIVNAIREAKLTGFVFIPLEEYTDEIPDDDEDEIEDIQEEIEITKEEEYKAQQEVLKQERKEAVAALKSRVKKRIEAGEGPSLIS